MGDNKMTVTMLIEDLQKIQKTHPNAQVKLHHKDGTPAMFAVSDKNGTIWLEGKEDIDTASELCAQYNIASATCCEELDFFSKMINRGFTVNDFRNALTDDQFRYAKTYMKNHGLI